MNLKDFNPDAPEFDEEETIIDKPDTEIQASTYHEEINTLKIEKLSNRITIISIIIPCLICAILIYAYLDIKARVVDENLTKQNQVEKISQQLEEKINELDIKIAKNRFDLDTTLPELDKKNIALQGQITKFAASKADSKTTNDQFAKLEKRVSNNEAQDKTTLQNIEKINKESQVLFNKNVQQVKDEITLFKEEFDARLLELSDYEQQIGELRKNLSLLDKKIKRLEQDSIGQAKLDEKALELKTDLTSQISRIDRLMDTLNKKLTTNISRLQNDIDLLMKSSSTGSHRVTPPADIKPKPQINIDSSDSINIKEESLKQ